MDILNFSPTLSDKVAIKSDGLSPLQIAVQVIEVVRPDIFERIHRRIAHILALTKAKIENISVEDIHAGPIRHKRLPSDLVGRIRLVRASLLGVYTHSMEFWLDGFKRDSHPSNEVAYWEHVAAVYTEYVSMSPKSLSHEQHKRVFNLILSLESGKKAGAEGIASGLPESSFKHIVGLYENDLPIYDVQKDSSSLNMNNAITTEDLKLLMSMDSEHFPTDLPSDLIRRLMQDDSQK
jgi:hypothetical protein